MTEAGTRKEKPPAKVPSLDEPAPRTGDAAAAGETGRSETHASGPGEAVTPTAEKPSGETATAETESPTTALRAELERAATSPHAAARSAGDRESAAEEPAGDRDARGPTPARVEYDDATLLRYLEALLFVSPHPLTVAQAARPLRVTFAAVRRAFRAIGEAYADRGIRLTEVAGGYQFRTAPECADVVRRFLDVRPLRLSKAALETLAVIAYRQPVTKAEVDDVRGVDSGSALKLLLDRNLVRVLGRKEEPGRPLLYGTTQAFLEFFNLPSLGDLPSLREYAELTEEGRRQLERDLFARSPEVAAEGEEVDRVRTPRRWEDLVEVLGDDLGELPEGVEIEVEPSDPLEAYVRDETVPRRPPPQAEAVGPGEGVAARSDGTAAEEEASEGEDEADGVPENGGPDDAPEDAGTDDDRS